ncbi:cAMP-dependent protein kinase catalytic subunit [Plasmodium reichenowi]|uniref:cAMP-dependent protein kinase catalytic subunit n=1 Tax=Plasmodium reichenowi TaxID=5854 RepID=A0A060RSZ6_PLARE|nr:cAMP-dependent protein kinase catalytic subunit [Plasmodium reichenowi]KYN98646.1 cAMP-dependent protein kinase catalytic subunit [Plasmodium reichenowi]CDO64407.1 cAMP-dependent protein kinase catalytic subunit [Plasmodium reichenowi]SOV79074.1 cAMP-dependent protein kinase catalytic subunit [Plasmodium reichenowi]
MQFIKNLNLNKKKDSDSSEQVLTNKKNKMKYEDFNFIRTLGTGSFGRVILATYKNGNYPPVAIKRFEKCKIIRQKQVDHVFSERKILNYINHPFCVNLHGSFKDDSYLYLVLEFVIGGEFFTFLRRNKRFPNDVGCFYAAQIVLIFEYLQSLNIVYRDLKPENLLLDKDGFIKMTDFGFAKIVETRTYTLCGTPEYIAPEILLNVGHGKAADWWTLGIFIYEILVGCPPFYANEPLLIYQKILEGIIYFPKFLDNNCKHLMKKLLSHDLTKRYGNLKKGAQNVKEHPWFSNIDWVNLLNKNVEVPYKPKYKNIFDSSNFERVQEDLTIADKITNENDPFYDW